MSWTREEIAGIRQGLSRLHELSEYLKHVRYFADVRSHVTLSGWRIWRDCRIYIEKAAGAQLEEMYPPIGIVWLHNPSKALSPSTADAGWQEVGLPFRDNPEHNAINYCASLVGDAIRARGDAENSRCANPRYCNVEELVYLESKGVNDIWGGGFSNRIILKESHARIVPKAGQAFCSQQPRFIWLAWGSVEIVRLRRRLFDCLVRHAVDKAMAAGVDVVFASRLRVSLKTKYVAVHWSAKGRKWTIRYHGKIVKEDMSVTRWDFGRFPALHPQELRNLGKARWAVRDDLRDAIRSCL